MKFVPNAVARRATRQMLYIKKDSPTLLFGAGVVGMVGATVLACRATLKLQDVLETSQNDLKTARTLEHREYSENDRNKDIAIIYTRSVIKVGRLYGPALLLGAASIGALTKSHNILTERNLALTAAYAAVDRAFNEYRSRVVDKYGVDADRELRYSTEEVEVLDEKGRIETIPMVGPGSESMYARFFDQYSPNWSKDPEYNFLFLRCQQNYANDLLKARGHIFLNEVYDMLGIERSKAGAVVGWVISHDGDNFIDFGIFDDKQSARDFVNGREGSILLDFNVDGVIYDRIKESRGERVQWQS
jgi:hypothetical protein